ncbi:MAG: efflux RND transporter permease subunit [Lachnospiraceae bacterium]|nr:efflux RND transporter permease subunit [Lachnospiraceae bacterium]
MFGKFSVKKPYTVLVAVVLVIVLGIVSFTKMTSDLLPNISFPYVLVMTTYPGASPETVEMVVTKPVESSMATVSNIEEISSISSENYSMVILQFAQSADMNAVSLEIRENLDQIKSYWDDSVSNPIIMKMNPDMLPVMIAAVGGKDMSTSEITDLTNDTIVPELESIEGVASVSAMGLLEESVNVIIRQEKIDAINEQVFGSIDEEIDENLAELQENKQDIYDGQAELENAKKELADSKAELAEKQQELNDSKAELENSKKELADGRNELADKKSQLESGKTELNSKKDATTKQLAEAETQLLTAKADAEAAKMHLQLEIQTAEATVKGLDSGIEQAQAGVQMIEQAITAVNGIEGTLTGLANFAEDQTYADLDENTKAAVKAWYESARYEVNETTSVGQIKGTLSAIESEILIKAGANDVSELQTKKSDLESTIADLQSQRTMAAAPIDQYKSALSEIEGNISKLDSALTELYKGNLQAAIEFANAQTTISLGEMQIASAESQLDSAQKQLESGEEQIKSGQEQLDAGADQIKDGYDQINDNAEQLADALQQILDGEEQIEEAREDAYDQADMNGILTVDTVEQLLAAQNFSMPAGYVTEDGISYLIRVGDKPDTIEELKAMPILNMDMDGVDVITLGDVADVFMTDNSADIYTNVNGEPGILLTMQKQTGYSTGEVSDKILAKFDDLLEQNDGLMLITLMDQGIYIDMVTDSIFKNIIFGAGLAIIILLLFLRDIRPTAVIACSIPISIVAAVVCMYFSGVTLNVISLSGLALGIGMLVDNSIVVIENIYRLRSEGASVKEAAIEGTKEVAGAIAASTLTTVCVFLPIVFTEGITRQLFVDMGLTIGYSLGASLLVALTVVPAMSSKILVKTKEQKDSRFFNGLMNGYGKVLAWSLKHKAVVFIGVLVLLIGSALASLSKGTAFMPSMESTQMTITLELPDTTPLTETAEVTDRVVEILRSMEDVEDVGAMASTSTMGSLMGGSADSSTHETSIYLTTVEKPKLNNKELSDAIEEQTAQLCEETGAELSIETSMMDMSALGGDGISIQVRGRDLDTLQQIAKDVAAIVEKTEGTTEVSDGLEESTGEMRILIDRDKAMDQGLTVAEVYQQIAAKLQDASSATTFETAADEYEVYVKNANDMALTRKLVQELVIEKTDKDNKKVEIPLKDIATFEDTISPKSVRRADQNRYIAVSASIADGYNVGLVSQELERNLADYEVPEGYSLVMEGENEMIMDAMQQLMLMLLLAVIFMYLIMVAQFQSLKFPFIIMFTIPLAFTGGFLGLFLGNCEVSVVAVIGFVMLAGIIVNNGIVIVDYMNQLIAQGMEKHEAILQAGKTRLRPVLMTALTTILGLLPMVFGTDMGAAMGKPMAIVTVGGLLYGTLLTLLVVPCIYDLMNRSKKSKSMEQE